MVVVHHMKNELPVGMQDKVTFPGSDANLIATVRELWDGGWYEEVAQVDSSDLETAWRVTNNVHSSWSMEPAEGVKVTKPLHVIRGRTYGLRSSMVGDVFVRDGMPHVVAACGFVAVEMEAA
jgi:hypothetical protein